MGQCSTLPAEARSQRAEYMRGQTASASSRMKQERDDKPTVYHRFNQKDPSMMMTDSSEKSIAGPQRRRNDVKGAMEKLNVPSGGQNASSNRSPHVHDGSQAKCSQRMHSTPEPMQQDDRYAPVVAPPASAKRIRCYKLNLDSEFAGLSSRNVRLEGTLLGPYQQDPPPLTYTGSEESASTTTDPTNVAIRTAQIFRGITVDRNGTILTQNARATRSNRGNKSKRGEKSRQASKIDKAKDLVEESIETGMMPNSNEPANLVSLYCMGEYDEMKYLVRDGSKKLRETAQYPDEVLLSFNRIRRASSFHGNSMSVPTSPSRKRVSPATPYQSMRPPIHQSAPPKLKGHPRDRPSSRRASNDKHTYHGHPTNHRTHESAHHEHSRKYQSVGQDSSCFSPHSHTGGSADWSAAGLGFSRGFNSIWNCGGTGAEGASDSVSPTHLTSREKQVAAASHSNPAEQPAVVEGRNDQHRWDQSSQIRV